MVKKFFLGLLFSSVGIFIAVAAYAQVCPHIYEGINCGANWYCNGCQSVCKTCPGAGDPVGATELNYVSCTCGCPSGKIVCNLPPNTCITPPACSTPTRENAATCNGCGACKAGYAPDPTAPDAPNPCLKAAYVDYANTGTYFQISGDLKSVSGDLYLANGKAIRVDGAGTTTLSVRNFTGTSLDLTLTGGLVVKGAMALTSQGAGTINAEKLCIQGSCRDVWPAAVSAFVDEGNTGFGPTAVLGTNDNVPLAFEVNNSEKMRIDTAGNVGIGTASPSYKLVVSGPSPREYIWSTSGNPELDLGDGTNHWAIYRDTATDQLRFWRASDLVNITNGGNVGIGTASPAYKLDVAGQINANTSSAPAILGSSSAVGGQGIYGWASDNSGINYGGFFVANGAGGYGVYGFANGTGSSGVYGISPDSSGYGIYGTATSVSGTNYGVYGRTNSSSGWGGYFTGGRGAYADKLVAGSAVDPGSYALYVTGDSNLTGNLRVGMGSSTNDDYIYFDDGTKYLKWEEAMGRFYFGNGNGLFVEGQLTGTTSINTLNGGTIYAYDPSNLKVIRIRHDGTNGIIEPSSLTADPGDLVLQSTYAGRYVKVQDDLGVSGGAMIGSVSNMGAGTLNASQLCINGVCQSSWPSSGGTPGAPLNSVQFNNGGAFGGDAGLIYNAGADALTVGGLLTAGSLTIDSLSGVLKASGGAVSGSATTSDLSEGANLYYTDARARASNSGTAPITYNSSTGAIGLSTPLAVSYGGTGGTDTPTAGGVPYGTGAKYSFTSAGTSGQFLQSAGSGAPTWATIPSGVSGSGSANYVAKFTAGTTIGNSQIYDDGSSVTITGNLGIGWSPLNSSIQLDVKGQTYIGGNLGVGIYTPSYKLHVVGDIYSTGTLRGSALSVSGDLSADNNTPSGCVWTAYAASIICPNGQFVAGVRYSASTVSAYCCEL